jgi:hypothetical protein
MDENVKAKGIALTVILACSLVVTFVAVSHSGTKGAVVTNHYVDISDRRASDDERHGSKDRPWRTLEYAFQQLRPGDTLLVREGTYQNETIVLTEQNSGRHDAPIIVKAYPGETVVLQDGKPIRFYGATWWIIDGLNFERPQGPSIQLGQHRALDNQLTVAAEHITIMNCGFQDAQYAAIPIFYGYDISIQSNRFRRIRPGTPFAEQGRETNAVVVKYIGDRIEIRDNQFEDVGSDGVHIGSQAYVPGSDIGDVEVVANEFWVNRPYAGILGNVGENGIDVKKCRGPILISGNKIHGFRPTTPQQDASGAYGEGLIVHGDARNVTIEGNLFYDNTVHLSIAQGAGQGPQNITIFNNVLRESASSSILGNAVEDSALQVKSATDVKVYHNTFYDNQYYLISSHVSRCVFKNNIVIGGKARVHSENVEWDADYNAWAQIAEPLPEILRGEHDISAQGLGLDADLCPQPNSPVIGAGLDIGIEQDFVGNQRRSPPSLGAFECVAIPS